MFKDFFPLSWWKLSGQLLQQLEQSPWGDRLGSDEWMLEPNLLYFPVEIKSFIISPDCPIWRNVCSHLYSFSFPAPSPGDLSSLQVFSFHWTHWRNLLLICVLRSAILHPTVDLKYIFPNIKRPKAGRHCYSLGSLPRLPQISNFRGTHIRPRKQHCCLLTPMCVSQLGYVSFQGIFRLVLISTLEKHINRTCQSPQPWRRHTYFFNKSEIVLNNLSWGNFWMNAWELGHSFSKHLWVAYRVPWIIQEVETTEDRQDSPCACN